MGKTFLSKIILVLFCPKMCKFWQFLPKKGGENFFNNTKQELNHVFEYSYNENSSDKSDESDSEKSDANNLSEEDQNIDEFTNHGTPFI